MESVGVFLEGGGPGGVVYICKYAGFEGVVGWEGWTAGWGKDGDAGSSLETSSHSRI